MMLAAIVIITMVQSILVSGSWYSWSQLNNKSFAVENVGPIVIAYDHLSIVTTLLIINLQETDDFLNEYVKMVTTLCNVHVSDIANITKHVNYKKLHFKENCETSVGIITNMAARIWSWAKKIEVLTRSYRTRRGPIDPLGTLMLSSLLCIGEQDISGSDQVMN